LKRAPSHTGQKRELVARRACPSDGRATQAVLTESGLAKVIGAAPSHVRAVRELVIDSMTPAQLRQLGTAAAKIGQQIQHWNLTGAESPDNC
jgi:DNA-binding MarR family transcriptional regulator